MKLGTVIFPTAYSIRPDDFARACEERGFESVWFPEHTHIPASRKTPYPAGGELPKEYSHTYDPFVALMAAAAVTKTIKVATGICLVIERDPIVTAKEVASLDLLSNGRFLFGVGGGWNVEEMENHGMPFRTRWKLLRERIEAMKEIWTKDEAEYHGELVSFDPIWSWPKPQQKPHPPIILGSASKMGIKRVVEYCDGWIPIGLAVRDMPAAIRDLHAQAKAKGRDPQSIEVSLFWAPTDADELRRYQDMGVARGVLALPPVGKDKALKMLDGMAGLVGKVA
ncbi:MAG: LLM class F420-dependent oxidoreductase [Deltaproteobacteria bacterium]|nr:LLM class F420-dependent oxidoreductase [Deltaproteobacteria bacterium]